MNSNGLKALVKDIAQNESLRSRFIKDPTSVISNYKLTDSERNTLLSTNLSNGNSVLMAEEGAYDNWF
jgi:hypothetical protein